MIVVDASAIIDVLTGAPDPELAARLANEPVLHAPHLLDTEVLHVLRRFEQRGALRSTQVESAKESFHALMIDRYPHGPLSHRVWALRPTLSAYDATYVALAEAIDATLVTTDARLGSASGPRAPIEVY